MFRPLSGLTYFFLTTTVVFIYQGCGVPFNATTSSSPSSLGDQPIPSLTCKDKAPMEAVLPRRLTKGEYNLVVKDLFPGLTKSYAKDFADDPTGESGYITESEAQTVSPQTVTDYWDAALAVTDDAFALNPTPVFSCATQNDACATEAITKLARRAYRRPATQAEIDLIFKAYKDAPVTGFAAKLKASVITILMSPQFIFRTNEVPVGSSSTIVALDDFELASKISFFIYGSIPDEDLLKSAEAGTLHNPDELKSQVLRMLKSPKSEYLARAFAAQWIGLPSLTAHEVDAVKYPAWNDTLKESMRMETVNFMVNAFKEDVDLLNLITAEYSFINKPLADQYGVTGDFTDTAYIKATLPANRRGLLTQASLLTINSAGDHTNPVARGKWVLRNVLCSKPPDPPANVPLDDIDEGNFVGESKIRARLELHRQKGATCTGCHAAMDPIGLAFENYSPIGGFRTKYTDNVSIDPTGKLPTGENIDNVIGLTKILEKDNRFPSCFTANVATFAQGANFLRPEYKCYAQGLSEKGSFGEQKLSDLIVGIVTSYEFLNRRVD